MDQSPTIPRRCQSDFDLMDYSLSNLRNSDTIHTKSKEKCKNRTIFTPTPIKGDNSFFQLSARKISLNFSLEKSKPKNLYANFNVNVMVSVSTDLNDKKNDTEFTDEINSLIELREDVQNPHEKDENFQYISLKNINIEPIFNDFDFEFELN